LALDGFLRLSKTVQAWAPFVTLDLQVGGEEERERRREEGGEGRKGRKKNTNKVGKSYKHIFITSSTFQFSLLPAPLPPSLSPSLTLHSRRMWPRPCARAGPSKCTSCCLASSGSGTAEEGREGRREGWRDRKEKKPKYI